MHADPHRKPEGRAVEFAGRRAVDWARSLLEAGGTRGARTMSDGRVWDLSLSGGRRDLGGLHTTSDFPTIMANVGERVLRDAYDVAVSPLKARLSRQTSVSSFRAKQMVQISGVGTLNKVLEHGEVERTTRTEAANSYKVETYASIIGLSRQLLVNDDLDAFGDSTRAFGRAAARTETAVFTGLLTANAGAGVTMGDGTPLFHANHGNVSGVGSTIDNAALTAARRALREQRDIDGAPIAVTPRFLVVSPAMETVAEVALATLAAATPANVNPFAGSLEILVDPFLTGNRWYVAAGNVPVFEHAYLNGSDGPQVATKEGWDVLGVEVRCVLDFGAGVIDYRGIFANAGAA